MSYESKGFVELGSELDESDYKILREKLQVCVLGEKIGGNEEFIFKENVLYSDGLYTGQVFNNKKNGIGVFFYFSQVVYHGTWLDDSPHGKGVLKFNSSVYEGEFSRGQFHGFGKFNKEGYEYKGNWVKGTKQGLGKEKIDGKTYKGEFFNNARHGEGVFTFGNAKVKGWFFNGNLVQLELEDRKKIKLQWIEGKLYKVTKEIASDKKFEVTFDLPNSNFGYLALNSGIRHPIQLILENDNTQLKHLSIVTCRKT